jgi:hypothetical protein
MGSPQSRFEIGKGGTVIATDKNRESRRCRPFAFTEHGAIQQPTLATIPRHGGHQFFILSKNESRKGGGIKTLKR